LNENLGYSKTDEPNHETLDRAPYSLFFLIYESFFFFPPVARPTISFFDLAILDWIESPTPTVTMRLYSDLDVDFTTDLHQPCGKVGRDV
jgi:hypothetical protein